jgi:adenylate cyclase
LTSNAPVPASAVSAESNRRPVSVLFADLCGFTALCERLDPEEVRSLLDDLFVEMSAAVQYYGGYIERFVGDSLLALFGAPTAHEDDPERALRAALDMFERTATLSGQWEHRTGVPLVLHIGINSGPAVVGAVGTGSARVYSVTGDTANTGARLQAAADEGEIYVGPLTYRLTHHAFEFEPIGDLTLKGKAEPLPTYRLLGPRDVPRPKRGLESLGLMTPMIGRDDELAQLLVAFRNTLDGYAQVVRLVGEAGVGKSRLLRSFFETLEFDGKLDDVSVHRASCSSLGDQPYGFLATILRGSYGIAADATLAEARQKLGTSLEQFGADESSIARIAPHLGYVLGIESDELRHVSPEQLKRQIFLATLSLFEIRINFSPLVVLVEDLQWADAASIELLQYLSDRLSERPFMLLLSHRPEFDAGDLTMIRAPHNSISLTLLSASDTEKVYRALIGNCMSRLPRQTYEILIERAGGIALYVEEIVRGLIEDKLLVQTGNEWNFVDDAPVQKIPLTIQGQLLARIDRLPSNIRRLIQEAAVLGPRFERVELRTISSEASNLESNLEFLCDSELLHETLLPSGGDGEAPIEPSYSFAQTLMQEVVYQNLLMQSRSELHAKAGNALESACIGRPRRLEDLESLGHHYSLSPDKHKGAQYLMAAGDWVRNIYANEDAVRHYRRALACFEQVEVDTGEAFEIRERLGDMLGPIGQREESLSHYLAVLEASEATNNRPLQARCLRKIAGLHWEAGTRKLAWECCEQGLALLDGQGANIELAQLCQEMGRLAFREGDNQRAVEWATRALEQAETLADEHTSDSSVDMHSWQQQTAAVLSHANDTLGVALARMGQMNEAIGHVERSVAVAEANGLLHAACRGYTNLGVLQSQLDPGQAIETSLKGLEIAGKIGDLGFQSRLNANLAVAYGTFTGRGGTLGIQAARESVHLDRELGLRDHLPVSLLVLAQMYQCHGEPRRAINYYQEAMVIAEESREPQLLYPCYDGLAMINLDAGNDDAAEDYLQKAQWVCEQAALDPDDLTVLPFLF